MGFNSGFKGLSRPFSHVAPSLRTPGANPPLSRVPSWPAQVQSYLLELPVLIHLSAPPLLIISHYKF